MTRASGKLARTAEWSLQREWGGLECAEWNEERVDNGGESWVMEDRCRPKGVRLTRTRRAANCQPHPFVLSSRSFSSSSLPDPYASPLPRAYAPALVPLAGPMYATNCQLSFDDSIHRLLVDALSFRSTALKNDRRRAHGNRPRRGVANDRRGYERHLETETKIGIAYAHWRLPSSQPEETDEAGGQKVVSWRDMVY
ncbi:hypothetical protein BV22DRAFT_1047393 [Leucogyrophana mollusca]|uniref:Uncharacterized protein n=1 Tax=Leucogyrophana mollusca TaxID=85980 RepID=A0ACB8BFF8_9AGAM|nr:hypothetical protein BV22DRAFT_1047393 [Leucogyrophana mollusca]